MSNTYLRTSFSIEAEAAELDLLAALVGFVDAVADESGDAPDPALPDELAAAFPELASSTGLRAALEDVIDAPIDGPLCISLKRETPTLMDLVGEQSPDVDALAGCIRATCRSALPLGFTFAITSDRPQAGAFNGGYMIVSEHGVEGINAATRMQEELQALRADGPLTPVQQVALDAYDDDGSIGILRDGAGRHRTDRMAKDGTLGDAMVLFILDECSDAGDDFAEAARMMEGAAEQLRDVADALHAHNPGEDQ
jgi:hypothetical protein